MKDGGGQDDNEASAQTIPEQGEVNVKSKCEGKKERQRYIQFNDLVSQGLWMYRRTGLEEATESKEYRPTGI